ncbi:SpaA isopeptide-forming pilin-related protein [Weissella confusa]|uniref:SpaA isopeptide-forming pilin-related protein n=1 Tax=Weissella confusa TaxID=1583 RepID=UPI0022FE79DA|nr:SpaA isopeptide-forming pilin-related protein [Weissella confusa]MDA5457626.1 hypothetical protein [Weissella confusa]
MAKWKNIALISTIVAPIAFGVGDAFAQANRPTNDSDGTTVVLHKRETLGAEGSGNNAENLYWGDGNLDTSGAFPTDTWHWESGVTFTAYSLGNIVSIDKNGKPKIAAVDVPGTNGKYQWDDILEAVDATSTPVKGEYSASSNQYAIEFVEQTDFDAVALQNALTTAKVESVPFDKPTDENGETQTNLKNGDWIILEDIVDGTQPSDSIETFATPMVLSLPMLNAKSANNWFGTDSGSELNLYPKNYTDTGNLRVIKKDGETNKAVKGATIAIMQLNESNKAALEEELGEGLLGGKAADIEAKLSGYAETGSLQYKVIDDAENGVVFNDLVPGQTYYVLEVAAPDGYLPNGKLQQATLRSARDKMIDPDVDGQDVTVQHRGGKYELKNYDLPGLDKDINVLKAAGATDLQVNDIEENGNPIYDNKDADYDLTFEDNDTDFGVSRGKPFNYTIDLETNGDIASYTKFGITDIVPYQVEINSWTLYARAGVGGYVEATKDGNEADGLVPILQAVDPDGNETEHSTTDGLSKESQEYNSSDPNPKTRGVSFKFYSQEMATLFGFTGDWINDKNADGYKASLEAQTQYIAANLIEMKGYSGEYHFDSENRAVQTDNSKPIFNGQMNINFSEKFLQYYGSWERFKNASKKQNNASLVFKMNAQTNSAAQANVGDTNSDKDPASDKVQTDMINNRVAFTYNNGYLEDTLRDQSQTHAVGWEFRKEDSKGNAIGDAGFDLGRVVTKENFDNVVSQLISANNNGHEVKPENLVAMADKLGYTGDEATKLTKIMDHLKNQESILEKALENGEETMVWFIHLDDTDDKQPVIDAMASNMEMGDIYWVVDQELSTTHMSGMQDETTPDGYFQYCGVADGKYVLHEAITPKGFKQMDDLKFTIGGPGSYYVSGKGADLKNYPLVTSAGDNQNMGSDNQITGENQGEGQNWAEIKNYKKSVLPVVGGVGALSLLFIGAIAMIASYIKRKTDMRES